MSVPVSFRPKWNLASEAGVSSFSKIVPHRVADFFNEKTTFEDIFERISKGSFLYCFLKEGAQC
jgi:hypothetical protein